MKRSKEERISPEEAILIEYLQTYLPTDKKDTGKILKTSQDVPNG